MLPRHYCATPKKGVCRHFLSFLHRRANSYSISHMAILNIERPSRTCYSFTSRTPPDKTIPTQRKSKSLVYFGTTEMKENRNNRNKKNAITTPLAGKQGGARSCPWNRCPAVVTVPARNQQGPQNHSHIPVPEC